MRTFKHFARYALFVAALALGILRGHLVQAQPAIEAWAQQWNASGVMVEFGGSGEKIAVDSSGNVIVAALVNAFRSGPYNTRPACGPSS